MKARCCECTLIREVNCVRRCAECTRRMADAIMPGACAVRIAGVLHARDERGNWVIDPFEQYRIAYEQLSLEA